MRTLTWNELECTGGGMIGSSQPGLLDASGTYTPGQNSWGESTPGGAAFYYSVLDQGEKDIAFDAALMQQISACTTGNLAICVLNTFQVLHGQLDRAAAQAKPNP